MKKLTVPQEILDIVKTLNKADFEAYLVGGSVRDLLLGKTPKDWDITTNAKPDEIIALFPKTVYENVYGTVAVVNEETEDKTLKIVEVTPYRLESAYSDNRHPDAVLFSDKIEDDLQRRDFTINALALDPSKGQIVDLYKGQADLTAGLIRAVGDADRRFQEDGLRMLRAVRFAAQLGFTINIDTEKAIKFNVSLLNNIAKERIRDEFTKIIMSERPMLGLDLAQKMSMLPFISSELEKGIGMEQTQAHAYTVWEHLLRSLQHAADKNWSLEVRLAALFHDIAKPHTMRFDKSKGERTFYGHDVVGAKITKRILNELRFPLDTIDTVSKLVRWHMFFSDTDQVTLSAVRRIITNVGEDHIWDLMNLRACDRIGTGRPKENPYRLRKYKAMIDEALHDPISVGMLGIDGLGIMEVAKIPAGPKIGHILHALLQEVLEDPKLNTKEYLSKKAIELAIFSEEELKKLGDKGKEVRDKEEEKNLEEIRKKHWVK